ncbi:MAG: ABC transporter substrate-binding protein, partial [Geminicoccales bacterium]
GEANMAGIGRRSRAWSLVALLGVPALSLTAGGPLSAAGCPTVAEPAGLAGAYPNQLEIEELTGNGGTLTYSENPLFAERVADGELPPVADRLPEEPLIYLPYDDCGSYGGTLRGLALALESGTSEILSWRQVNLVRFAEDLRTLMPNVAKAWQWNDDYSEITFTLRKGHKWSDGAPFTADDVVFYIDDIIKNEDIHGTIPAVWNVGGSPVQAEKIDAVTVKLAFGGPYPGFLHYLASGGSYFVPFAPKHFLERFHPAHNPDAEKEAKAAGFDGWAQRFGVYWNKWMDAVHATAYGLEVPSLESHLLELEPNTQRRVFVANPYYFKVDSSGQQLPYIDRHHERFLEKELFVLEILNGNVDQKAQNLAIVDYPVFKEAEPTAAFRLVTPPGGNGPYIAFNQTHKDPALRQIYGDVRFRQAMSLAIDREEINELLYLGLGTPEQALPINVPFVTDEDKAYMIEHDPDRANQLLDEMGLERGSDGIRLRLDGQPLTVLWEYSLQFTGSAEYPALVAEYWKDVGVNVLLKEITTQLTREKAAGNGMDINMEWDVPFEPNLISDPQFMIPVYSELSPLMGVPWRDWINSDGKQGEEPPTWVKQLNALADEWLTVVPGGDRYMEIGREMIRIHLANLPIIGTLGNVPSITVLSRKLANVTDWTINHYNYGRTYSFRPDQWYYTE